MNTTLSIDGDKLLSQLRQLGQVGAGAPDKKGRTRLALSDTDKLGRDLVVSWMRELDLDVRVDRVGNLFGVLPGVNKTLHIGADHDAVPDAHKPLMIGSHIDTVDEAGMFDGCYGVLSGLAVVRALREAGLVPPRPLVVAAFTNEEGVRYHPDMLGSLVYAGGLALETVLASEDKDGLRFGDELARIGYAGTLEPGAIRPAEYFELHVEQGPVLEQENRRIGVVEGVQGIYWQRVTVQGDANHAGTTPTRYRHDAGLAAARAIARLRRLCETSGSTVGTVGVMSFEPNLINVIPRKAIFTVDMRDPDEQRLQDTDAKFLTMLDEVAADEGVTITTERLVRLAPVAFDPQLVQAVEDTVRKHNVRFQRMTSGAGHDAQMMARLCRVAMIFVPSQGGISHNPAEHTDDADLLLGATILLETVQRCL